MADVPLRLAVLQGLTAVLESITIANGYKHDLMGRVKRGKLIFGNKDALPFVCILDPPTPTDTLPSAPSNPANYGEYPIVIQGFAIDDLENPTDPAILLMSDVRQALAKHKLENRGGRPDRPQNLLGCKSAVTKLDIGLGTVRPPEDGVSDKTFFWQFITLGFAEVMDDPYGWDTR